MATRVLRRGLPRVPGGEPWPPADTVAAELAADGGTDAGPAAEATPIHEAPVDAVAVAAVTAASVVTPSASASTSAPSASAPSAGAAPAGIAGRSGLRRGLPRVPGGEPWPPADTASSVTADVASVPGTSERAKLSAPAAAPAAAATAPAVATETAAASTVAPAAVAQTAAVPGSESGANVRRGLPRVAGGEPWPPAGTVPALQGASSRSASPSSLDDRGGASASPSSPDHRTVEADLVPVPASAVAVPAVADLDAPLPWTRTVWNGRAPRHITAAPESGRRRPTWTQAIAVLLGAAALGLIAGAAVAFVRTLLSFPFMQDFLTAFPGHYEPAIAVEPGFSPWIGWQHFFNMFLMVLIIRSGLQVRTEKRPTVFWTPRGNAKGKISLNLWFHQSLDILWLVNGVIFVVLLFVTGHWVRIVPTSWEVFPNALSAALQYVSFDWPHENGWNNYNSLQQLAYFATVFLAAPLAAITGFRMSGLWPKNAEKLSKAYPVEWARALHFPIMLYFVAFIIAHVALVMLTGFLANLNHMFAAQDAVTWTGFWVFIGALVVIAIGWVAARPLVLAPIAKAFGKVSGR